MSPKEKAKDLISKFIPYAEDAEFLIGSDDNVSSAKQCALIAVEEILKGDHLIRTPLSYWQSVKTEIEKL